MTKLLSVNAKDTFNKGMLSSNKETWSTPDDLFEVLNDEYSFSFDLAASKENAKCQKYFTVSDDSLSKNWHELEGVLWCNPPYARGKTEAFVKKAYEESKKGAHIVMLLACRPDTHYWHKYIFGKQKVVFIRGKLKFKGGKDLAPFPSALVMFGEFPSQNNFYGIDKKTFQWEIF